MVTQDEYGDLLETVFGEIETKLLWVRNEANMDCGTDSEGEEAMLLTIDQLLRSVVHIAGDIEEGDVAQLYVLSTQTSWLCQPL